MFIFSNKKKKDFIMKNKKNKQKEDSFNKFNYRGATC